MRNASRIAWFFVKEFAEMFMWGVVIDCVLIGLGFLFFGVIGIRHQLAVFAICIGLICLFCWFLFLFVNRSDEKTAQYCELMDRLTKGKTATVL